MDFTIARFFNHLGQGTIVDNLSVIISYNGGFIGIFILLALWALWKDENRGKKMFVALAIAVAMHLAISEEFFKVVVPHYFGIELRPYIAHPVDISPLGKLNADSSFPSNHMSSIVTILGVMIFYYRKYWKWAVIFAILMAFSRMHNGMHYPSDVIAGTIFGLIYSQLAVYLVEKNILKTDELIEKITTLMPWKKI